MLGQEEVGDATLAKSTTTTTTHGRSLAGPARRHRRRVGAGLPARSNAWSDAPGPRARQGGARVPRRHARRVEGGAPRHQSGAGILLSAARGDAAPGGGGGRRREGTG